MRVWELVRGTIRQFAVAMATEPGSLPADEIEQQLVGSVWNGDFERDDHCALCLPWADASGVSQDPNDGSWRPIGGSACFQFTREDLRAALMGGGTPPVAFDVLKLKPISTYDADFRQSYLDRLTIETTAVKRLLARLRDESLAKAESGATRLKPSQPMVKVLPARGAILRASVTNGDKPALARYLDGDRSSAYVTDYFRRCGVPLSRRPNDIREEGLSELNGAGRP